MKEHGVRNSVQPTHAPNNALELEPGQVFHCPIHVHLPGIGYIGVSEQVLITDNGCEVLGDRDRTCARQKCSTSLAGNI